MASSSAITKITYHINFLQKGKLFKHFLKGKGIVQYFYTPKREETFHQFLYDCIVSLRLLVLDLQSRNSQIIIITVIIILRLLLLLLLLLASTLPHNGAWHIPVVIILYHWLRLHKFPSSALFLLNYFRFSIRIVDLVLEQANKWQT